MGIWNTNNGNKHNVNIKPGLISAMRAKDARFCWFQDNPGINDETNEVYFETTTIKGHGGKDEEHRSRRENITVTCEDGERITGYVTHQVAGYACDGTDISDWFIFQPGTYPTCYNIQHSVDQDDVYIEEL